MRRHKFTAKAGGERKKERASLKNNTFLFNVVYIASTRLLLHVPLFKNVYNFFPTE